MDQEAGLVLDYYLERKAWTIPGNGLQGFWEGSAGGYRLVGTRIWNATKYQLGNELQKFVEAYRLPAGQPIWVTHVGPNFDLPPAVSQHFPGAVVRRVSESDEMSFVEAVLP
jgi:hypothetical protein